MTKRVLFPVLLLTVVIFASCRGNIPAGDPISADNFLDLTLTATGSVLPYSRLVWAADSSAIVAADIASAQLLDGITLEIKGEVTFSGDAYDFGAVPDGKSAAFTTDGQTVTAIDIATGDERTIVNTGGYIGGFDFSPDGSRVLTVSQEELAVAVWDAESGEAITRLTGFMTAAPVYDAGFGSGGEHVVWISRGTLQISDVESGFMSDTFGHEDLVTAWALSHDGKYLASAAAGTVQGHFVPQVLVWDTTGGEPRMLMNDDNSYEALAFCPDTHLLAIAQEVIITIINLDAFDKAAELNFPGGQITDLAFSPDGRALAAANADGIIKTWRVGAE